MANSKSVDHDAVLRARTMLLGSGRRSLREEVQAYRVLAQVSPSAYLGKLATALVSYSYAQEFQERPEIVLALCAEAVGAAREIGVDEPQRTEVLVRALGAYERQLFDAGRREEGLAACEEAADAGKEGFARGQVASEGYGSRRLGIVLAEEGRHEEAVEVVRCEVGGSFWELVQYGAELDVVGRAQEASAAFGRLADDHRDRLGAQEGSLAMTVAVLVQYARLPGTVDAAAVRGEALGLLKELSEGGERRGWSDLSSFWSTLLALSARSLEPAGAPAPAYGAPVTHWSPDVRRAYFAGLDELEREAAEPDRDLKQRAVVQHRLTVRSTLYHEGRVRRMEQPLRPLFDESVSLARELGDRAWLARTLTDRAMFEVAAMRYREAYSDFREAVELAE
ncbi:hypothetical protein [Streptomyces acidiscabies]|uniref:Tetratricopeptide repeat protein n=1 Tax=Streptomyces acidiscabies TaxID=42234 RepID=A0AAP6EK43_9ACTN|nr:hypothetical protein [Streptomyces acidiscabies]MBZ3911295.1 hypothetical protein [Streptomyces acidiscabies]MDX2965598.1 hypothetical protein [Streptomyces acidiscabies]MDX3025082.1 hypothetical protein [Streptomyces acidiscabies]MDX3795458.1 hypothetical protein [Streptomyces acidiscabies]